MGVDSKKSLQKGQERLSSAKNQAFSDVVLIQRLENAALICFNPGKEVLIEKFVEVASAAYARVLREMDVKFQFRLSQAVVPESVEKRSRRRKKK